MKKRNLWRVGVIALCAASLGACETLPPHSGARPAGRRPSLTPPPTSASIPAPVLAAPVVPAPKPKAPAETYTVVVNDVSVRDLLFSLARDAKVNVDISPRVTGKVTLNAVHQTLDQILQRISRQVDLRYRYRDGTLVIGPDTPYEHVYRIDYVNLSRDGTATTTVATQVATTGGGVGGSAGDNNSTTAIKTVFDNRFWATLTSSLRRMIAASDAASGQPTAGDIPGKEAVIANPESGLITVFATAREQRKVQAYLDRVMANATREVLIEATIVEVSLNDQYQAGINWAKLAQNAQGLAAAGFSVGQQLIAPGLPTAVSAATGTAVGNGLVLNYQNNTTASRSLFATLSLLKQFGNTRVLSSPKIMALNNQTAVIKAVTNQVYFTAQSQIAQGTNGSGALQSITTTPHVVPVGVVMTITPQISADGSVTLSVRPTVTRVSSLVRDPNPQLTIPSEIPQIDVREMESVLKLQSGQIAVLGGLMQNSRQNNSNAVPGLSDLQGIGALFKSHDRQFQKTEIVVFLRPIVIRTPSVTADLSSFRDLLPAGAGASGATTVRSP